MATVAQTMTEAQNTRFIYNIQPHLYQPLTPIGSAVGTPSNVSPTSPRTFSHFHARQIRPHKTVLPEYIPAVLRPTEKPCRKSPPTPPKSAQSSFDSARTHLDGGLVVRLKTGDSLNGVSRVVTDEWNENLLAKVTGPPTRNHWKADSSTPICDDSSCPKAFTFLERRHHCRRCGQIFCAQHSDHVVPLDQEARFHPDGHFERACETCFQDYRFWKARPVTRKNSDSDSSMKAATPLPTGSQVAGLDGASPAHGSPNEQNKAQPAAASVPRDWDWSTF